MLRCYLHDWRLEQLATLGSIWEVGPEACAAFERLPPLGQLPRDAIDLVEGLTAALRTRSAISCAKGILMERHGLTAEAALDLLKDAARCAKLGSRNGAINSNSVLTISRPDPIPPWTLSLTMCLIK